MGGFRKAIEEAVGEVHPGPSIEVWSHVVRTEHAELETRNNKVLCNAKLCLAWRWSLSACYSSLLLTLQLNCPVMKLSRAANVA